MRLGGRRVVVRTSIVLLLLFAAADLLLLGLTLKHASRTPVASADVVSTPSRATAELPVVLWVGDSYTQGDGARDVSSAESVVAAARMGWICNLDAERGTGFIAAGAVGSTSYAPLGKRLNETARENLADIMVVDAGRNDADQRFNRVRAAVTTYVMRLRAKYPDAKIVMIVPYLMRSTSPMIPGYASFARRLVTPMGGVVIDPLAEGWIGRRSARLVASDGVHPNQAGHRYVARHLVADFRRVGLDRVRAGDGRS